MSENCRILSVVVSLTLALALSGGATADVAPPHLSMNAPTGATVTPSGTEVSIVRTMNAVRAARGLPGLQIGRALQRAARSHSVDMARRGYFDHGSFVQRLRRFGVRATVIGENLAYATAPGFSANAVVQMWLASPPHRANLLDRSFRRVGVGVAGSTTRLVTADFAGR